MSSVQIAAPKAHFGQSTRPDRWWIAPLAVFLGFSAFIVYSTWAALQGAHYRFGPYLSPFYSPELMQSKPDWWPSWAPFSAAMLILWAPGGFRLTCYYYRGAYYKAFWADPPACTVGEPRQTYRGERSFPLILQNVHRYFLYLALLFLVLLAHDVWDALWFADPATGGVRFGIGVGTIVLAFNVTLLGCYAFGCHSLRHLVGGGWDEVSRSPLRSKAYDCVGCLNRAHMRWAWFSLFWVAFSDIYVRLCSMGIWTDWRIL
jgi:hypothetical protein